MKKFLSSLLAFAMLTQPAFAVGKVQQQGFKTAAECIAAGATIANCLLLDQQVYVTANGVNTQLSTAIANGVIGGGGGNGQNFLLNSSFEGGTTAWTSTNETASVDTTNFTDLNQSLLETLSSQLGVLSQDVTPSVQLGSVNMSATCYVKTSMTTLQVCDRKAGVQDVCAPVPSTNTWQPVTVNFVGPSSGSVGVQVGSTASSTGTYNVDQCYIGKANNLTNVSQAQLIGQVKVTGCTSQWNTSATSLSAFGTQTGCTYQTFGQALAPSTNIPGFKFASLAAGDYTLVYSGAIQETASLKSAYFQWTDGTNTAKEVSQLYNNNAGAGGALTPGFQQSITYTTPQSNVTLQVFGYADSGGSANIYGQSLPTGTQGVFSLYYFPSGSQLAYQSNKNYLPTVQKFTSGSGTYIPPTGVSYIKVKMVGGGGGGGGGGTTSGTDGGAGGNTTFGTSLLAANGGSGGLKEDGAVTSGGTASLGTGPIGTTIQGGSSPLGSYGATVNNVNGGSGASSPFGGAGVGGNGTAGTAAIANTGSGGGGGGSNNVATSLGGNGGASGGYIDAIINGPSSSYSYAIGAAGTAGTAGTNGNAGSAGGSGYIEVTEYYGAGNAPITIGSVTSNSSGTERTERLAITTACTSGTCAIGSQSGNWLTSVTFASTGNFTGNIAAGIFSAAPTCVCTNLSGNTRGCSIGTLSASTFQVTTYLNPSTSENDPFTVFCMGPR
jgi:hypothetical protein